MPHPDDLDPCDLTLFAPANLHTLAQLGARSVTDPFTQITAPLRIPAGTAAVLNVTWAGYGWIESYAIEGATAEDVHLIGVYFAGIPVPFAADVLAATLSAPRLLAPGQTVEFRVTNHSAHAEELVLTLRGLAAKQATLDAMLATIPVTLPSSAT